MTIGAGLLVRSFWQVRQVDPGFDSHGVLAAQIGLNRAYDTSTKVACVHGRSSWSARARFRASRTRRSRRACRSSAPSYTSDFIALRPPGGRLRHRGRRIAPCRASYFTTMKVPVLRGRAFTSRGSRSAVRRSCVINEALARSYFHGQDPIGQRIAFDKVPTPKSTWYTIVGVVGRRARRGASTSRRGSRSFTPMAQEPYGDPTCSCCARRATRRRWRRRCAQMRARPRSVARARSTRQTMDDLRDASMARVALPHDAAARLRGRRTRAVGRRRLRRARAGRRAIARARWAFASRSARSAVAGALARRSRRACALTRAPALCIGGGRGAAGSTRAMAQAASSSADAERSSDHRRLSRCCSLPPARQRMAAGAARESRPIRRVRFGRRPETAPQRGQVSRGGLRFARSAPARSARA